MDAPISCPTCRMQLRVPGDIRRPARPLPRLQGRVRRRAPEPIRLHVSRATSPGRVRDRNEDGLLVAQLAWAAGGADHEITLMAVLDGMGGHAAGDRAAAVAAHGLAVGAAAAPRRPGRGRRAAAGRRGLPRDARPRAVGGQPGRASRRRRRPRPRRHGRDRRRRPRLRRDGGDLPRRRLPRLPLARRHRAGADAGPDARPAHGRAGHAHRAAGADAPLGEPGHAGAGPAVRHRAVAPDAGARGGRRARPGVRRPARAPRRGRHRGGAGGRQGDAASALVEAANAAGGSDNCTVVVGRVGG